MIFLTGDTHIPIDISKLNSKNFPQGKTLTRDDYVIALGDFGLYWHKNKEYKHWRNWLQTRPWTTLWLDGNHENFDWIDNLETEEWHGGIVHKDGNIIHLMRGQVFDIDGLTFFTFGGAESVDVRYRTAHVSWWPQESPNAGDIRKGVNNLARVGNKVDYVLSHTCPFNVIDEMFDRVWPTQHTTEKMLQELADTVDFKAWYFGHWHHDIIGGKYNCLYNQIVKLKPTTDENAFLAYPAVFAEDHDYGGYTVSFPDLPGCITEGDTMENAKLMAADALDLVLESMEKDGEPLPIPSDYRHIPLKKNEIAIMITRQEFATQIY